MKLYGLTIVKNEEDFIEVSLKHNAQWFDKIYVLDNGSIDSTWDIIQDLKKQNPNIVAYQTVREDFRDGLRARIFNEYKSRAKLGDWWCRLDADEIYPTDPKPFLQKIPKSNQVVWSIHLQYYLTEIDQKTNASYPNNKRSKITNLDQLPKYYLADASEPRFFRHREGLTWTEEQAWPKHMGLVHPERLTVKHYQWRSPQQIQKRLNTRNQATSSGYEDFKHYPENNWQDTTRNSQSCHLDRQDGSYHINESDLPNHLLPVTKRRVQVLLHRLKIWK